MERVTGIGRGVDKLCKKTLMDINNVVTDRRCGVERGRGEYGGVNGDEHTIQCKDDRL